MKNDDAPTHICTTTYCADPWGETKVYTQVFRVTETLDVGIGGPTYVLVPDNDSGQPRPRMTCDADRLLQPRESMNNSGSLIVRVDYHRRAEERAKAFRALRKYVQDYANKSAILCGVALAGMKKLTDAS